MKSTNLLTQEHKLILRALDILDAMAASIESGRAPEEGDVDKILEFLTWFADAHHQAKEETILFPAIKARAASEERPVQHMIFEHDQERQSIEELETAVRLDKLADFASCANRLSSKLRHHIYKEDELLFPAADLVLNDEQDAAVFERLNRFDTALDRQILEQKLGELRSLEWKYLRK